MQEIYKQFIQTYPKYLPLFYVVEGFTVTFYFYKLLCNLKLYFEVPVHIIKIINYHNE